MASNYFNDQEVLTLPVIKGISLHVDKLANESSIRENGLINSPNKQIRLEILTMIIAH